MHSAVVGTERIDHGTMRTINLALLLGTLRSGPISRAELSRRTHLSKASITSLAAELAARGLVREGSPDRNGTRVPVSETDFQYSDSEFGILPPKKIVLTMFRAKGGGQKDAVVTFDYDKFRRPETDVKMVEETN